MPTSAIPDFVRKGTDRIEDLVTGGSSKFIKLESGVSVEIVPLTGVDEIIAFNQHAIWRRDGEKTPDGVNLPIFPCFDKKWCPGEIIGDKPRFRSLLVVIAKDNPAEEMILAMGKSMFDQLVEIESAIGGSVKGMILRVTRSGKGKNDTKYTIIPTGRRVKIDKSMTIETILLDYIGPTSPDEVVQILRDNNMWTDDHQEMYEKLRAADGFGKTAKAAAAKPKRVLIEEDEDEEEEEEILDLDEEEEEEEVPVKPAKKSAKAAAPVTKATKPVVKKKPAPAVEEDDDEDSDEFEEAE